MSAGFLLVGLGSGVPGAFDGGSSVLGTAAQQGSAQGLNRLFVASVAVDNKIEPAVASGFAPGGGAFEADGCPVVIYEALGRAGCMISFCESHWNPDATGPGNTLGYFQIASQWHPDATHDPAGNVAAAVRISSGGTDWSAWGVRSVLETGVCPGGLAYPG